MFRTRIGRTRGPVLSASAAVLAAVGLAWDGAHAPASAQAYNGGPNQVIVNMDVLNGLPAGYGAPAQPYGRAPKSQFLPGAEPQGYVAPTATNPSLASPALNGPVGAPRYLPPYTPYGATPGVAQPLPLAPGLAGLAVPPSSTPSSVLTTLGPDGRPIQPIKLKQPGAGAAQAAKPKEKEFAAPAQPAMAESAAEPVSAPEPATSDSQMAAVEPPTPPAEPGEVPDTVPMPAATPAPEATGAIVETAPAAEAPPVETPEAPAPEAPVVEQAAAEPPAPAAPAEEAVAEPEPEATENAAAEEAPAEEVPAEETTETAETPAPDDSAPAAPIPQGGIRIVFPTEINDVPPEANAALDDLASQMLADESMRIQIMCYASGTEETESKARRKSLARCINIRQYLFKKDVRTTRMDVRALGLKSEGQPADRVDIVPATS